MGKSKEMMPANEVFHSAIKYKCQQIESPHMTGLTFKIFVNMAEIPFIGPLIISYFKKKNKMLELLRNTVIPEAPMFKPEFPPQEPEQGAVIVEEAGCPEERVATALKCLPEYNPADCCNLDLATSFRYWKIRDFAHAYQTRITTPSLVAENLISALEEYHNANPTTPLLISYNAEDIRKQAAACTKRFEEGNPISILDGIFMAMKDDIDCYPHPTKGATTWLHEFRPVKKDSISVSRLRNCGVILIGKGNMHEFGLGTTGNNANYGTPRNPHAHDRYTGGSSSGPAVLVASGLCSAALGTDGGGSVRIPSSLCGVVGLKTTFGRTDMRGSLCVATTVAVISPLASSVEDAMLVYAAVLGSSPIDKVSLKPSPPCFPNMSSKDSFSTIGSLQLGKYTEWFNDVESSEISQECNQVLNQLSEAYGCQTVEIAIPEIHEMRFAHIVSIGSEALCSLNPYLEGNCSKLTYDTRTNLALFQSFTATDYVAAQKIRRRIMYHHMEIFKQVDIIVTPTTGMTAPIIPLNALDFGETNINVSGYLMRFTLAGNLLGLPAITIPVGYDKQGLPIGLQLIGRPWGEATILRLALVIEELCGKHKNRPALYYDILKGS